MDQSERSQTSPDQVAIDLGEKWADYSQSDPLINNGSSDVPEVRFEPSGPYAETSRRPSDTSSLAQSETSLQTDYARLFDDLTDSRGGEDESQLPSNLNVSSFKKGFFTPEQTQGHLPDDEEISAHHKTGDFPHLRHLVSLSEPGKGHHRRHHHHHKKGKKHRPEKQQEEVSDTAEVEKGSHEKEPTFSSTLPTIPDSEAESEQQQPELSGTTGETPDSAPAIPVLRVDDLGSDSDVGSSPGVGFYIGDMLPSPDPGKRLTPAVRPDDRKVSFTGRTSPQATDRKLSVPASVKFKLGDDAGSIENLQHSNKDQTDPQSSPKKHSRHHHHAKIPSLQDLESRRRRGSEVVLGLSERSNTTLGIAESELDKEQSSLTTHRFADPRALHRRRVSQHTHLAATTVVHVEKKPKHDHSPHELFVELDELYSGEDHHYEWKEKARWIKYEEDVEEGADRWGKPHVSSLSFHSLLDLRKCIEQGVVLLDLEEDNLPAIASLITEEMLKAKMLRPENRGKVLRVLLQKHKHQDGRGFIRRNSTFFQLYSAREMEGRGSLWNFKKTPPSQKRRSSMPTSSPIVAHTNLSAVAEVNGDASLTKGHSTEPALLFPQEEKECIILPGVTKMESTTDGSVKDSGITKNGSASPALNRVRSTSDAPSIMKRIPDGAESTSVLVGSVEYLDKPIMAFVRLAEGLFLENFTEVSLPVRFIFILMGPPSDKMDYHEIGRSISTLMSNTSFHDTAYMAETRKDLLKALNHFLDESVVLPPGEIDKDTLLPIISMAKEREKEKKRKREEKERKLKPPSEITIKDSPLKRTGRPFGGLVNDIKKRYPLYWSDIKDAFNLQCLATWIFIYFAALSPAITFGGLISDKLDKWIGVSEMLVAVFSCGIIFALISGQPLLILGSTGPLLVFEEGLYKFCQTTESLEYISFRVWVGFWVTIITAIFIGCELIFLVRYFTRFTEEIFGALISLIFIIETFIKVIKQFEKHPLQQYYPPPPSIDTIEDILTNVSHNLNTTLSQLTDNSTALPTEPTVDGVVRNQPNTALLSVILTFGTFIIAYFLKQFRNSHFLGRLGRRSLGDFGIPIAIVVMVVIDVIIQDTYTEKLDVPDGLKPTDESLRAWVINPMGMSQSLPVWACFAAVIPAGLVFILIFMESQITSMIVNKKDHKLKKGAGYHLDIMIIGSFASMCGVLGIPFVSAATVRSVSHTAALSVYSKSYAPGEKPKLVEVKEQRVTALLVHITIGVSILLGPVLRQIALAILFGVFLYMGVASMSGIQLFERVALIFMPVKHHPDVGYVRKVRTWKMHLFTVIQLLCLALLWAVKSTAAALAFPFVLVLMVPFRLKVLRYIFTKEELQQLDKEGEDEVEVESATDEDPDFYEEAHNFKN